MVSDTMYSITQNEWKILLALSGEKQIYGLFFEEEKMTERELLRTIYGMTKKGMVEMRQQEFVVLGVYKQLVEQVKRASFGISMCKKDNGQEEEMFWYIGETVVLMSQEVYKKNCFCVYTLSVDELFLVLEEEWMPCYQTKERNGEPKVLEEERAYLERELRRGLLMRKFLPDGKEIQWMFQGEWKGKDWIFYEKEKMWCRPYTKQEFLRMVRNFIT